jgi:nucleoside-diphosphate kinase
MSEYSREQTLVLIKPDALKLSLTGYILSTLAEPHTGLRLAGAKIVHVTETLAKAHYAEHRDRPFFRSLIDYLMGRIHYTDEPHKRRVIALVYCGEDAVSRIRKVVGPTNPHIARERAPGTIRSLGTLVVGEDDILRASISRIDNLVHASATLAEAEQEIKFWFKPREICPQVRAWESVNCSEHYYCDTDGILTTDYREGLTCLVAPGRPVWKSDLDVLREIVEKGGRDSQIWRVAAKYFINDDMDFE